MEIAGVVGEIEIGDRRMQDLFVSAFSDFLTDASPRFSLRVEYSPQPVPPEEAQGAFARFLLRGSRLTMEGEGGAGTFDYEHHRGTLVQPLHLASLEGFLTAIVIEYLLDDGGVLLHAAGVKARQGGVVFFGPSGSGKTTLAERLKGEPGVDVVSDEAIALRPTGDGGYHVEGLPWRGRKLSAPLRALFHLSQGPAFVFHPLGSRECVRTLWPNVYFTEHEGRQFSRFLEICEALQERVPCYRMEYTRSAPVWPEVLDRLVAVSPSEAEARP